jgi:hypothetical protein
MERFVRDSGGVFANPVSFLFFSANKIKTLTNYNFLTQKTQKQLSSLFRIKTLFKSKHKK